MLCPPPTRCAAARGPRAPLRPSSVLPSRGRRAKPEKPVIAPAPLLASRCMIYHLAEQAHWQQALRDGRYTGSTRGRSLADEGFIHASSEQQWPVVRSRFYADVTEPLVLLHIDEVRLSSRVVEE